MRSVLITGCSDGGMGAELARAFQNAGLQVYATARDVTKMTSLQNTGIILLPLDICSDSSIANCVAQVPSLDILINNAGALLSMPLSDLSIAEAKKSFDTNVWGHLAVVQAFLPLLRKSANPLIANHTSVGADMAIPFQGVYNASKAAMAVFSDVMRIELGIVGIRVVNLKTGGVKTNLTKRSDVTRKRLPEGSMYIPARDLAEAVLTRAWAEKKLRTPAAEWAREVCCDLLKESPPAIISRGDSVRAASIAGYFPSWWMDGMMKRMCGLDLVEAAMQK